MKKAIGSALLILGMILSGCNSSSDKAKEPVTPPPQKGTCIQGTTHFNGIVEGGRVYSSSILAKKVVLLTMEDSQGDTTACTGTPISSDVILTAAHCVYGTYAVTVNFTLDAYCSSGFSLNSSTVSKNIKIHPGYDDSKFAVDDVALIKLNKPIPSDYEVSEIYDGVAPLSNQVITLIGFGKTHEDQASPLELRFGQKKLSETRQDNPFHLEIDQTSGPGICQGDSGGPVFVESGNKFKIVGVNSVVGRVGKSGVCHGIGIAMVAPSYLEWIQKEMPKM